jgi:hypothetical protein
LKCAEDIPRHGKVAALHVGEKQSRSPSSVDASLDSPDLKVGINLLGNTDKFATRLQSCQALRKTMVTHSLFLLLSIYPRILSMQRPDYYS